MPPSVMMASTPLRVCWRRDANNLWELDLRYFPFGIFLRWVDSSLN